jgi:putative hydrolase of HD superfamily
MQTALRQIAAEMGDSVLGGDLISLWMEYEEGVSLEANIARQFDKFEMIVQANEYELANPGKRLDRFFESTQDSFQHPEVSYILPLILR